jgi:peroxin-3
MLHAVKTYVGDRRKGIVKAAGIAGGVYLVRRYMMNRFQEMQDKLQEERLARERYLSFATTRLNATQLTSNVV